MEGYENEAFENASSITDNNDILNQVVNQSDLSVSDIIGNGVTQEDPKKPITSSKKEKPKRNPILEAAKVGGTMTGDAGLIAPGMNVDKYKKYLPASGDIIATPLDIWDKERAIRQSNADQAGNAGLRILGNIIPEILQQGSRMLDFSGDYSTDNAIGEAMQQWKDAVNEGAPIYRENPDTPLDFGDFAYWMEQGSNLVTSAAAFAAIGYATAGVGDALLAGRLAQGARLLAAEGVIGSRTGAGIAQFMKTTGNGLLNTYMLNRAEGVGVAIDTYKEKYEKSLQELKENNGTAKKSEAQIELEAKKKAAEAASFAYNLNQVNILLNLSSSFAFIKPFANGSRLRLSTDGLMGGALNTATRSVKQEILHNAGHLLREGVQEYAEETINYIAQKRAVTEDNKKSFKDLLNNALQDASSEHGIEAGFWGFLGGIGQTGFTRAGSYIPMHKNTAYNDAYNNAIGRLQNEVREGKATYSDEEIVNKAQEIATQKAGSNKKRVSSNYLKEYRDKKVIEARQNILNNFKIEDDENLDNYGKNNILQASDIYNNVEEQFQLYDEQQDAYDKNDIRHLNEINDKLLTNQIERAISTGTLNTLEQSIKEVGKLSPEEAQKQGFDTDTTSETYYKKKTKEALDMIKVMETNAIINEKYLNNEDVNELDKELLIQNKLFDYNNKQYTDYRRQQFNSRYANRDLHTTTPYLQSSYADYVALSNNERQALYTPEQIAEISKKAKENEELINRNFNTPTQEELNNDTELKRLWDNKNIVQQRIEVLGKQKEFLTSKETQSAIKQAKIEAERDAINYRQQLREANKRVKEEEKRNKKLAEEQVKQNKKESANEESTSTENQNSSEQNKKETTATQTQVEEKEDGSFEFKEEKETTLNSTTLTDNDFFNRLKATYGKDNSFIIKYENLIQSLLSAIQNRNDNIDNEWFDKRINALQNKLINTKEEEKALLSEHPDLISLYDKGIPIISQINNFLNIEIARFKNIKEVYGNINEIVSDINIAQEQELNSFDEEDNAETPLDENENVDFDALIEDTNNTSSIDVKNPLKMATSVLELINKLSQQGIEIKSFKDLYIQLSNASSKSLVDNILPRLKSVWNFIIQDNIALGKEVNEDSFSIDDIAVDVNELIENQLSDNTWSENEEISLNQEMVSIVNDINQSMVDISNINRTTGTGAKSTTSSNIAYNAREHIGLLSINEGITTEQLTDANNDLNENTSYDLFDPSKLPIGTELSLLPLGIGNIHSYYDFKTKNKISYERINKDEVRRIEYDNNVIKSDEILSAIDHLPIFISKSSKATDIIQGAFLHTTDWINTNNIAGDINEVELQRQLLQSLREKIVNNLTKEGNNKRFIKVRVQNRSLGVPITTKNKEEVASKRIKQDLVLGVVANQFLKSKPNESINFNNTLAINRIPNGSTFIILPVGKQRIAYPLRKTKLNNLTDNHIKDSIKTVLELFFTEKGNLTQEQNDLINQFKELGLNVKNYSDIKKYLKQFIYTDTSRKSNNKQAFNDFISMRNDRRNDLSVFRLTKDERGTPYLQFGKVGATPFEINFETLKQNKQELLDNLDSVLDNTYINSNLEFLNSKEKIIGVNKVGNLITPSIIYNNYNDMIKDVSLTSLDPKTITNPKTGRSKTIYTFQNTIELSEPINTSTKKPIIETKEVETLNTELQEEPKQESKVKSFLGIDKSLFSFDEFADKRNSIIPLVDIDTSLEDKYTFIKGLTTPIQVSIINNIKNVIEEHINTTKNYIPVERAFNAVLNNINQYISEVEKEFNDNISNFSEEEKEQYTNYLSLTKEKINIIKDNKDKIVRRTSLFLKQEGITNTLVGKERTNYLNAIKKNIQQVKEIREKLELDTVSEEEKIQLKTLLLSADFAEAEDLIEMGYDEDSEGLYEITSISVNPKNSLTNEIKSFFNNIRETDNNNGTYTPKKNYLGLYNYVPFNSVYQKLQELLAIYPNKENIPATYENYINILKQNQYQIPYLTDVINKLEDEKTSNQFRQQFVMSMYKMYNNTVFLHTKYDPKSESYVSYLINTDSSNYANIIKNNWITNFNTLNNTLIVDANTDNPKKLLKEEVKTAIYNKYTSLIAKDAKVTKYDVFELFNQLGIEIPSKMLDDLENKNFYYNSVKYDLSSFVKDDNISRLIHYITGNPSEGTKGIDNLLEEDLYGDSSFNKLANMIAIYEDNLTSNSSKNLEGDMIFNYGEVKNIIDNFNKLKNNLPYLIKSLSDPYRQLDEKETIDNKKYKTWLEQLLVGDTDNLQYNEASEFYKAFNYFTFLGGKVKDADGNDIYEVDKYSSNGYTKAKLNLFLNQGNTVGSDSNQTHIANYMFFTMSDKKVPMGFSAPSIKFDTATIMKSLLDNNSKEANHQLNYLFDSLVKPDIKRMLFLANKEVEDSINIKGYSNENSRFFTLPILNLIDFNYVDGDINNERDDTFKLKEQLGLSQDENLFEVYGEGKNTKKQININVLQKPEVQAFIKEKMRKYLKDKYIETTTDLINAGIIERKIEGGKRQLAFPSDNELDVKAFNKLGYENKSDDIARFIMNYMLNTTSSLAQMQQLLIGDPIQFYKESGTTAQIKKELELNLTKKAVLNNNIKEKLINETEALNTLESLNIEYNNLLKRYNKSWAIYDILDTNNNQGKRLAGDNASGSKIGLNDSFNLLVIDDSSVSTNIRGFYYQYLVPDEIKNLPEDTEEQEKYKQSEINKIIGKYDDINQADAQELTTLREHLNIMVGLGEISEIQASSILQADEDGVLTFKEFSQVMQPMKLVYSNNYIRDNINSRLYVKSSSFPLAKTFTKGLPIDELRQFMEKNNIQRTAFKSAVKVGQPKSKLNNIVNKDNTFNLKNTDALLDTVIREVPREGHKKQQNVPYDENKHQINDGTQKAKLLFLNLMDVNGFINPETNEVENGRQLYNHYKEIYRQYYKIKYDDLISELYPSGFNNSIDYEKLQSIILDEAETRGFSENDMAYFELNQLKNGFEFPLWLSNNEGKLTSLLNSIVDNRIRKRKREGKSAVLLSDVVLSTDPKYKSNFVFVDKDRKHSELQTMRNENGKIVEAEVVISFPFRDNKGNKLKIKDFLSEDKTHIDIEKLPQDILDTIGFRIPTQGLNSMNAIKIVGFLPEQVENTVIAPRDFITQMGSDFDVDKLYQDLVNTHYEDGKLSKLNKSHFSTFKEFKDYKKKLKTIKRLKREGEVEQDEQKKKTIFTRVDIISKELEKTRGELTQEEYLEKGNQFTQDLELKYLENLMLDYNKAVLMNPDKAVQNQRTQPIDSAVFREITEEIVNDVYSEDVNENWSAYFDSFQTKKYIAARGGKTGVSTYSSTSVLNTVLQTTDYTKTPITFQYYNAKEEKYIPNEYKLFGKTSNILNNPYSIDGKYKSDIIQALQSISVDNENLQIMHKLNLNDYTSDFVRASTLLGFSAKDIFYLINHPVVREYVRGKQMGDRIVKPKYYYEQQDETGNVKQIPYTNKEIKDTLNSLTHNEVIKDIELDTFNEDDIKHFAIYNLFEELTEKGKTLKSIESLLNTDSKGLGSNLFYSLEKENAILNLVTNKELSHLDKLLGDFRPEFEDTKLASTLVKYDENNNITKDYREAKREYENKAREKNYIKLRGMWFKANNIPSMATVYALVTNNKIWSEHFPYHTPIIDNVTNLGLQLENNKKSDKLYKVTAMQPKKKDGQYIVKEVDTDTIATTSPKKDSELKQKVLSSFKSFLFTSIVNDSASDIRKDLFLDNNLANIIHYIKKNDLLPYNSFIKRLSVLNENKDDVNVLNNIKYDASGVDTISENGMVLDIISLLKNGDTFQYEGKDYSFGQIGQLLIAHQMITGGIQKANEFIKHIPPHYLKAVNLYNNIIKNLTTNPDLYNLFLEQYLQHNPNLVVSPALNEAYKAGIIKIQDGVIKFDSKPTLSERVVGDSTYNYISIQNPNNTYSLFKRSNIDEYKFIRIPVLGKNQILEYDINANKVVESIFEENNPNGKWYKNEHLLRELEERNLEPNAIKNEIDRKLSLGEKDKTNINAILKVCK